MPRLDPLTRRQFVKSAVATAAVTSSSWAVPLPEGQREPVKVGILHSLTGVMAISESALHDAELLAIEQINQAGGVLGRKIEPVIEDPRSDFVEGFPGKAQKLLSRDKVAVLFGCWTSIARKNTLPQVEKYNGLLFYPVAYEGNECSRNVVYTGQLPNQQVLPAVDYFWQQGKRKFFLLGSDYIYPRTVALLVTHHLKGKYQAAPVGDKYVPLFQRDFADVVKDIKQAKPDVVINAVWGDSLVALFAELAAAKLTPAITPVCSLLISEYELRGLDPDKVKGHFAAAGYFQSIDTPRNKDFVKQYVGKTQTKPAFDTVEAAYASVWLWKAAVEKAKSFEVDKVREAVRGLEIDAPSGKLKIDEKNLHAWKKFRLGRIRDDRQFDVVYESKEPIRPEPYPPPLNARDCDWTKGGLIQNPPR